MRTRSSLLPPLLLSAALVARSAEAHAACETPAPGEVRDRARQHFQAGISAFDAKRYSEAVDHLTCANQLAPHPAFAYNIGVTYEAMGDVPTALRWFREHLRQSAPDADTSAVKAKVAEFEGRLQAKGVQQVSVLSSPAGAVLSLDDRPVGLTPMTLELHPGNHRYRLTLAGHAATEGMFELRSDRSLDVQVELRPERATVMLPSSLLPPPAAADAGGASPLAQVGTWTWVTLGAGALGLGGALGFELRRAQLDGELEQVSQLEYQERYDAMQAQQTTARVLAGFGGAALIGGALLLFHDLGKDDAGEQTDLALGGCARRGLCISANGAF